MAKHLIEKNLVDVLAACLAAPEQECVSREHDLPPEERQEVQELLALALELTRIPLARPSEAFRSRSFEWLMSSIQPELPAMDPI
ncbi:MAG: hypothetical protein ACPGWR_13800 [Ardenticatenaceae bacterium]